jgi:hypothetical protein
MKKRILILILLFPTLVWSGDEFQTPELINGSSFECTAPEYRVIGAEKVDNEIIFWAVAKPELVLKQKSLNQIIKDIYKKQKIGSTKFTEIWFYSSVGNQPKFPAFRITDHLAVYNIKENKTYFSVAAKELQGGWAYGPSPLN